MLSQSRYNPMSAPTTVQEALKKQQLRNPRSPGKDIHTAAQRKIYIVFYYASMTFGIVDEKYMVEYTAETISEHSNQKMGRGMTKSFQASIQDANAELQLPLESRAQGRAVMSAQNTYDEIEAKVDEDEGRKEVLFQHHFTASLGHSGNNYLQNLV